jgi:hypothetical protein
MNLFVLSECSSEAAQMQCNAHVTKMVLESAQMLSTAHRILDGNLEKRPSKSGKSLINYWVHPNSEMEEVLYKAVHHHHPCTKWTMESSTNYQWHYEHFIALSKEFEYRYEKVHLSYKLLKDVLCNLPKNIGIGRMTPWRLAMQSNPECMFPDDPVKSYRLFYQTKQDRFKMEWKNRTIPEWFKSEENKK